MNYTLITLNSTSELEYQWGKPWNSWSNDMLFNVWHAAYRTSRSFTWPNFKAVASSLSNMWRLLLIVLFFGYFMTELPRTLWNLIKCALQFAQKKIRVTMHLPTSSFVMEPSNYFYYTETILENSSLEQRDHRYCYHLSDSNFTNVSSEKTLIQLHNQVTQVLQKYSIPEMKQERLKDDVLALQNHYHQINNNHCEHNSPCRMCEINVRGIEFWPFIEISSCSELQSPINILTQIASHKHFAPLSFVDLLNVQGKAYLTNANQTAAVMLKGCTPLLEGGPLRGSYKFEQLHFHWSQDDSSGSEHSLDGQLFSMECHAVHIHIRCKNVSDALKCENGIAVVGNFLQVSDTENKDFLSISNNLRKIQEYDSVAEISSNCFNWLKNNGPYGYYTYPGSLTTPLKSKMVTWILYPDPIFISSTQIQGFRKLLDKRAQYIGRNCRNIQNLNNREIYFAI